MSESPPTTTEAPTGDPRSGERPFYLCSTCGEDFASLEAFDRHRVGKYLPTGPAEYLDRVRAGLVDEDWTPELGRRCLEPEEMRLRRIGMNVNEKGRWYIIESAKRAHRRFR